MSRDKLSLPGKDVAPSPAQAPQESTGKDEWLSLEFLKLVYRHDKDPDTLVQRALELKRRMLAPES